MKTREEKVRKAINKLERLDDGPEFAMLTGTLILKIGEEFPNLVSYLVDARLK